MAMFVRDLMSRTVVSVRPTDTVKTTSAILRDKRS